jgi:two-component system, chemotaxis family, sensor kinase Cph1
MDVNLAGDTDKLTEQQGQFPRRNEELEGFAEIVAHDLKEPLRGIRSYVDHLMHEHGHELSAPVRETLWAVHRLAGRTTERIEALYRYLCCRRFSPEVIRTDPRQVISDVVLDLKPWLDEHSAQVSVTGPFGVLDCDPALLTEIFHNLVTNAVKYNDCSEPLIQIGAGPEGSFFVQDNGIGIREEDIDSIFHMYRRLHGCGQYGGGTGTGLTIVRCLIERHGGKIWVESALGQGSTFRFTLGPPAPLDCARAGDWTAPF